MDIRDKELKDFEREYQAESHLGDESVDNIRAYCESQKMVYDPEQWSEYTEYDIHQLAEDEYGSLEFNQVLGDISLNFYLLSTPNFWQVGDC
tara:strand:+ start:362 stop:637 length:276 start_codon:yes stop_codon:yes gene_type:complete